MNYLGDFQVNKTIHSMFSTNDGSGGRVEPSTAFEPSDIYIFKDDSATKRNSTSGVSVTSPYASMVGVHYVSIDLSDNDDAGFYSAGSDYTVVLYTDKTVDSQNISKVLFSFSLENRGGVNAVSISAVQSGTSAIQNKTDELTFNGSNVLADIREVNTTSVTSIDEFKADVSSLATSADLSIVDVNVSAVKNKTDELTFNGSNILADIREVNTTSVASIDEFKADVSSLASSISISAVNDNINNLNDVSSGDILTTALTESYGTSGSTRTLTQLLYELKAMVTNFNIVGLTLTTKKLDGTTDAKTYTINDNRNPTQITETT